MKLFPKNGANEENIFAPNGEVKKAAKTCKDTWDSIKKLKYKFDQERKVWLDPKKKSKNTFFMSFGEEYLKNDDGFYEYVKAGDSVAIGETRALQKLRKGIKMNIAGNNFSKLVTLTRLLKYCFPKLGVGYSTCVSILGSKSNDKLEGFDDSDKVAISAIKGNFPSVTDRYNKLKKINFGKQLNVKFEGNDTVSFMSANFNDRYNKLKSDSNNIKVLRDNVAKKSKTLFDQCVESARSEFKKLEIIQKMKEFPGTNPNMLEEEETLQKKNIQEIINISNICIDSKYLQETQSSLDDCRKKIKHIKEDMDTTILNSGQGSNLINEKEIGRRMLTIEKELKNFKHFVATKCINGSNTGSKWSEIAESLLKIQGKVKAVEDKLNLAQKSSNQKSASPSVTRKETLLAAQECLKEGGKEFNFMQEIQSDKSDENMQKLAQTKTNNGYSGLINKIVDFKTQMFEKYKENELTAYMYCTELCCQAIYQMCQAMERAKNILESTSQEIDRIIGARGKTILEKLRNAVDSGANILVVVSGAGCLSGIFLGAAGIPVLGWILVGVTICATLYRLGKYIYDKYKEQNT